MRLQRLLGTLLRLWVGCRAWFAWQPGNPLFELNRELNCEWFWKPFCGFAIATYFEHFYQRRKFRSC